MHFSSRTIYNIQLQTEMMFGSPYTPLPNTTLNESYSVNPIDNSEEIYPTIKYFTIGLPITSIVDETIVNIDNIRHKPKDGNLFLPVPFVIRRADDDLSEDEREKYRLRTVRVFNSIEYICYYLKLLDDYLDNGKILSVTVTDEDHDVKVFSGNDAEVLNPIPTEFNYVDVNSSRDYLVYVKKTKINLCISELEEIKTAIETIYGNETPSRLGEIALVTGRDTISNGDIEVIDSQIAYYIDSGENLNELLSSNVSLTEVIDVGGMEPIT